MIPDAEAVAVEEVLEDVSEAVEVQVLSLEVDDAVGIAVARDRNGSSAQSCCLTNPIMLVGLLARVDL